MYTFREQSSSSYGLNTIALQVKLPPAFLGFVFRLRMRLIGLQRVDCRKLRKSSALTEVKLRESEDLFGHYLAMGKR